MDYYIRLFVLILTLVSSTIVCKPNETGEDLRFKEKIDSLIPSIVQRRLDELHQIRNEVSALEYAVCSEYYSRKYYDLQNSFSEVELSAGSIIMEATGRLLEERRFTEPYAPYILMRCAEHLSETGYPKESALFAGIGIEVALTYNTGSGYIYGELRCLEADIDADDNPEGSLATRLRMLVGFKLEYERDANEDTFNRYLRNLIKTSELAIRLNNVEL